jgi:hypothetical protein
MINSGQMERAEALRQEEQLANTCTDGLRELLEHEVGLQKTEVARIMGLQPERSVALQQHRGES